MKIEIKTTVDVPHADLWAAISDFGGVQVFNPVVETSVLTGDTPNHGLGIQRLCTFYDGNSIVETVKEWREGSGFTIEMTEMNMPFKMATRRWTSLPPATVNRSLPWPWMPRPSTACSGKSWVL